MPVDCDSHKVAIDLKKNFFSANKSAKMTHLGLCHDYPPLIKPNLNYAFPNIDWVLYLPGPFS